MAIKDPAPAANPFAVGVSKMFRVASLLCAAKEKSASPSTSTSPSPSRTSPSRPLRSSSWKSWLYFPIGNSRTGDHVLDENAAHTNASKDDDNDTDSHYIFVDKLPVKRILLDDDLSQDWVDDFPSAVSQVSPASYDDKFLQAAVRTSENVHGYEQTFPNRSTEKPSPNDATARSRIPDANLPPKDEDKYKETNHIAAEPDLMHAGHREAWKRLESSCMEDFMDTVASMGTRDAQAEWERVKECYGQLAIRKHTEHVKLIPSTDLDHLAERGSYSGQFFSSHWSAQTPSPSPPAEFETPSLDDPLALVSVSDEDINFNGAQPSFGARLTCDNSIYRFNHVIQDQAHDSTGPTVGKRLQPPYSKENAAARRSHRQWCRDAIDRQLARLLVLSKHVATAYHNMAGYDEITPHDQHCCDRHRAVSDPKPPWRSTGTTAKARWTRSVTILGCLATQHSLGWPLERSDPSFELEAAYDAIDHLRRNYGIGPGSGYYRSCQRGELPWGAEYEDEALFGTSTYSRVLAWRKQFATPDDDIQGMRLRGKKLLIAPKTAAADDIKGESASAPPPARKPLPSTREPSPPRPSKPNFRRGRVPGDIRDGHRWRY